MNEVKDAGLQPTGMSGRIEMRTPDEVSAMLALKSCGWGTKRTAAELGCSRNTVKRWLSEGGWRETAPVSRRKSLDGLGDWVAERFRQHAGNADVVRQELAAEKNVVVSLRTVERAVAHLRQALRAEARATVRFETRPGQQLQMDFGERRVWIGDAQEKVFFFVATLGHSRRLHVRAFRAERQQAIGPAPCMVADDGELIAGHGRVLAATMLGLAEVAVIRLSHFNEAERRA